MKFYKLMLAGAGCARARPGGRPRQRAEEVRRGCIRHRDQDRQHQSLLGHRLGLRPIGKAIEAYFKMVNDKGGINGRKINFITYDDGYAPPKTVEMVRKLVEEDKVLFVFQTLGTPSNTAIHKYLNGKKVPQLFVATGASKSGASPRSSRGPWAGSPTIRPKASSTPSTSWPTSRTPRSRVLMQNDDYGKDYFNGFKRVSARMPTRSCRSRPTRWPTRRSTARSSRSRTPAPTCSSTSPRPSSRRRRSRRPREIGWKPAHYLNNVSSSVGAVMKPAGFDAGQGILTASYLKDPTDPQWAKDADMVAWNAFMDKYYPGGDKKSTFPAYAYAVTLDACRGAQARRRRPHARERHEAGGQPQGRRDSRCCCPASRSTPARRTSIRSSRCSWRASRARRSSCSANVLSGEVRIAVTSRLPAQHGGQPALYNPPIGHTLPGGLSRFETACHDAQPATSAAVHCQPRQRRRARLPPPPSPSALLRAASGFAALGVRQGDCVALLLRNDFAFLEASLAAVRLGAYAVPINWHFKADEVAYVLADCGAKVLVAHADLLAASRRRRSPPASRCSRSRRRRRSPPAYGVRA